MLCSINLHESPLEIQSGLRKNGTKYYTRLNLYQLPLEFMFPYSIGQVTNAIVNDFWPTGLFWFYEKLWGSTGLRVKPLTNITEYYRIVKVKRHMYDIFRNDLLIWLWYWSNHQYKLFLIYVYVYDWLSVRFSFTEWRLI